MAETAIAYITAPDGNPKAVVIPIDLWRRLLPQGETSLEQLAENLEDYCLSNAMDEAQATPLLSREEAMRFLAESDPGW
ncbi:hypothetical protein [Nodosilinea sp. P-1105]|uniref:hypothetical protein n=1 Tax=Nodosilinea sp. P-1105 TaxID=2546229 RepID=UPI00146DF189|nr:hypothetical protein [Nodosilinea sp. P-1105]NMF86249.1 hypothetical protein [Nodosilinea sp. P-1105]